MRWTLAAAAVALAGCSLIYNPNNLPDPRMIDAAVVDTNPCALTLTDITPKVIDEGRGDLGAAPALLVVHGNNIVNANLKIALEAQGGAMVHLDPISDAVVSADHTYAAFTVTARVDKLLGTAGPVDVPLDVTVTQDTPQGGSCMAAATATLAGKLTFHALPELTAKTTLSTLEPRYSMVDLANVTIATPGLAVVNAVSSITMKAVAANATLTMPGPGGNAGTKTVGACPTAGGGGGIGADANLSSLSAEGGGGGGAGGASPGTAGATGSNGRGGAGGAPGIKSGSDVMAALEANAACAGGGGGLGGTLVLTNPGGPGGGGGGTLALVAGGNISVTSISASGGQGSGPAGAGGAGGGGGAGGNVLVTTETGSLAITTIDVHGGPGGSPGGGAGANGRFRWDAPAGNAPAGATHRGPSFAALTSHVFTTSSPPLTVVGTNGDGFSVRVVDQAAQARDGGHASINNGRAVVMPVLQPGFNQVCITLDGGVQQRPESDKCIEVAFLP
jgi:hypothetical protein